MFYSVERDRVYGFSQAHSIVNHVIASRKDTPPIENLKDLEGKSVIVMAGDVMDDLARSMGFDTTLVRVPSLKKALELLASGEHDYALVAQVPALYFIRTHRLNTIQLSRKPIVAAEYCYAAPSSNGYIVSQLSQGLTAIQSTGEYRTIEEKWLSPYRAEHNGLLVIARIAAGLVLALTVILLIFILWSWSLKQKVIQKTKQLSIEIAERSKAEEEVRQLNQDLEKRVFDRTAQLEAAIKELEAFSYAVSHDLRAPLRAMEGFSSVLSESYGQALDETGKDYLQRLQDASTRMGRLIEDLLGLSRVTRYPLIRKKIDLSKMVSETFTRVLESGGGQSPSIIIEPGMTVMADASLTAILLSNLLENAVKYSAKSESPRIEVGSMPGKEGGATIFWVKDNGIGFDMSFAGRLFEPFHRLHADKEYEGTGIGLVTIKRIVTRHGGSVWPEASPGKGACFYFTLE
jgi:signal transduction histidine kinase